MAAAREAAQRAVEELGVHYRTKARVVTRAGVGFGAVAGVLVGAVPLTPLRFAWPIPSQYGFATILAGLGVGVLIGYVVGDARGQLYRRMAEQARLQLRLEERISANDARIAELVAELHVARAADAPAEAEQAQAPRVPHLVMAPPLGPPVSPPS